MRTNPGMNTGLAMGTQSGQAMFKKMCAGCHTIGVGDKRFWGFDALEMVAALLKNDPWFDAPHWDREGEPRAGVQRS